MPARTRGRHRRPPVPPSLSKLGERLRLARKEAGLSQRQLGSPHFTRAYISALELGKIRPAMRSLEFLAGKLGRPASSFIEDEEHERRRRERELGLARASQLIAEGKGRQAVEEVEALNQEGLSSTERLEMKRMLGRAYMDADDNARAVAVLGEVVRACEALGDEGQTARARGQLGAALLGVMVYGEAEEHLSAALRATASGTVRDPLFKVHVLHNLGLAHYHRDNYSVALEHFQRAAEEGKDVGDQKWLASLYAAMGMSRSQVGDFEGAITCFRRSEALFDAIHNQGRVADIRFVMARTLKAMGNRARAEEVLAEATTAAEKTGNESLAIRIEAFRAQSDTESGNYESARSRLEGLLPRAERHPDPHVMMFVRFALAQALIELDPRRAEAMLREMAGEFEGTTATGNLADVYNELSNVLARQGRSDEALRYSQMAYATNQGSKKGANER